MEIHENQTILVLSDDDLKPNDGTSSVMGRLKPETKRLLMTSSVVVYEGELGTQMLKSRRFKIPA